MVRRARLVPAIRDFYLFDEGASDEGVGGRGDKRSTAGPFFERLCP